MEESKEAPKIPNEVAMVLKRLQTDHSLLVQRAVEIMEEKREHELVLETMNGLNKDRRCWRMIGGVLVEKNVELLMPDITLEIDNMSKLVEILEENAHSKAEELRKFQIKYGLSFEKKDEPEESPQADKEVKASGVLV